MSRMFAALCLLLAACASEGVVSETAVSNAVAECRKQRLAEGSGNVGFARCRGKKLRQIYAAANYKYMDLVELFVAYSIALAERRDSGELTAAEYEAEHAALNSRWISEDARRHNQAAQTAAQQDAAYALMLGTTGTFVQTPTAGPLSYIQCFRTVIGFQCQ